MYIYIYILHGICIYNINRIHGAAIYGNIDPINIPQMLAYIYTIHGSYGIYYVFLFMKQLSIIAHICIDLNHMYVFYAHT